MDNNQDKNTSIVLAAGGTGGHTFPAESVAKELISRGYNNIHLITDSRFKNYSQKFDGVKIHYVKSSTNPKSVIGKALAAIKIVYGIIQTFFLFQKIKPSIVIGFGGYPSFPAMIVGVFLSKSKTAIHEQNAVAGRVNALLANRVDLFASSFEQVSKIDMRKVKFVHTGNPVRSEIVAINSIDYADFSGDGNFNILVTGGSQGTSIFSQIIPSAIATLPENLREKITISHQCRKEDLNVTSGIYENLGVKAEVATFFNDIPTRLSQAHLVICRAGASSIFEILVAGRPAILVPYPFAKDNHQAVNAEIIENHTAVWVMNQESLTAQTLAARIEAAMTIPNVLKLMASRAKNIAIPDATKKVTDNILNLILT